MIEKRLLPEKVAEMLRKDPNLVEPEATASSNQQVTLSYIAGRFVLGWSANNIDSNDWVALYRSASDPDSDFISGAWQWAKYGTSFATSQALISGYQARYLIWNASIGQHVSVVRTNPFPFLRVCSA